MKKLRSWFSLIFSILIILFLVQCQVKRELPAKVTEIIESVKAKYHPDKRISVFDVKARLEKNRLILTGEMLSAQAKEELKERLQTDSQFEIVDSLVVLPAPEIGENKFGLIRVSVAQMRRGSDVDQEIVSQELLGHEVKILKQRGWWYYIQAEDNYLGWVMKSSVVSGDSALIENWRRKEKLIVSSNYGQIWEQPRESCQRSVCDVVLSNTLAKLGFKNGWYQVELPDGRTGFIRSNLVQDLESFNKMHQPAAEKMIDLALTFSGIPYFWGGKSTKGFDCSGFTQTVYKMFGMQLPRDANMQVKAGSEVKIDEALKNLQPADLLFFGSSIDGITHVGLYIGDGLFIHSDGWVQVSSFFPEHKNYSEYRRKGLRAVRRIL